jgi:hypothetical protein
MRAGVVADRFFAVVQDLFGVRLRQSRRGARRGILTCTECGSVHERHPNAAINLEKRGLAKPELTRGDMVPRGVSSAASAAAQARTLTRAPMRIFRKAELRGGELLAARQGDLRRFSRADSFIGGAVHGDPARIGLCGSAAAPAAASMSYCASAYRAAMVSISHCQACCSAAPAVLPTAISR